MNPQELRNDIPILKDYVYLDAASTTPTPRLVVEAMNRYYYEYNANTGRGAYSLAVKATEKLEEARRKVADFVNAKAEEIIFTKNTTESINLVATGLRFEKGDSIIIPNIEHHSNYLPWLKLREKGVKVKIIKADKNGIIDPGHIEDAIDENTKLITVTHVSNAIGSVQDIKRIGRGSEENNILFMVDAAQSFGHMKVDVKEFKADFIAFPGHKGALGPVGTGFLFCNLQSVDELEPPNLGGGTVIDVLEDQFKLEKPPKRFEAGTLNIAGFIGLGKAIDYLKRIGMDKIEKHGKNLTRKLYKSLTEIDAVECYGDPKNIYGIVSFNIDSIKPDDVARMLDEMARICVRSGHHCAIPAMRHLGVHEKGGTVRASIHYYNILEDIEILIESINEIVKMEGLR